MKTKLTLFVTVLAVALFGQGCASTPKGPPVPHAVKWNGHWYAFFADGKKYSAAKKHCEDLGGHLIVIDNAEENQFALDLSLKSWSQDAKSGVFGVLIGAEREKIECGQVWKWLDGRPIAENYQNFGITAVDGGYSDRTRLVLQVLNERTGEVDEAQRKRHGIWDASISTWGPFPYICEWD